MLMLGVAGRSRGIRVEVRAANRGSRLYPDASGRVSSRLALDPDGPAARGAGSVAREAAILLRRRGLPVRLSRDAGRYLCNASYYRALAAPVPVLSCTCRARPATAPGPGRTPSSPASPRWRGCSCAGRKSGSGPQLPASAAVQAPARGAVPRGRRGDS